MAAEPTDSVPLAITIPLQNVAPAVPVSCPVTTPPERANAAPATVAALTAWLLPNAAIAATSPADPATPVAISVNTPSALDSSGSDRTLEYDSAYSCPPTSRATAPSLLMPTLEPRTVMPLVLLHRVPMCTVWSFVSARTIMSSNSTLLAPM